MDTKKEFIILSSNTTKFFSLKNDILQTEMPDTVLKFDNGIVYAVFSSNSLLQYDFRLPDSKLDNKNLLNYLQNEIAFRLPIPQDNVVWCYRLGKAIAQVTIIRKNELNIIIERLKKENLKCDYLLPDCFWSEKNPNDFNTPGSLFPAPKSLLPPRNNRLKKFYSITLLTALTLLILPLWRNWSFYQENQRQLDAEINRRTKIIRTAKLEYAGRNNLLNELQNIRNQKYNIISDVALLRELSRRLPEHTFVSNYSHTSNGVDITIESGHNETNIYNLLQNLQGAAKINLRKTRGNNETTLSFATLKWGNDE